MNRQWKIMLILLLAAGIFLAEDSYSQSDKKTVQLNQYRLSKLAPFVKSQCALHLVNGEQIQGKVARIEPEYLVIIEGSGPFYIGEKRIPIFSIQRINSEKKEQVFICQPRRVKPGSNIVSYLPEYQLVELFAILDAADKPLLAKSGIDKLLSKPEPQPVKKTVKPNEIEIIDLINAQATNEEE